MCAPDGQPAVSHFNVTPGIYLPNPRAFHRGTRKGRRAWIRCRFLSVSRVGYPPVIYFQTQQTKLLHVSSGGVCTQDDAQACGECRKSENPCRVSIYWMGGWYAKPEFERRQKFEGVSEISVCFWVGEST